MKFSTLYSALVMFLLLSFIDGLRISHDDKLSYDNEYNQKVFTYSEKVKNAYLKLYNKLFPNDKITLNSHQHIKVYNNDIPNDILYSKINEDLKEINLIKRKLMQNEEDEEENSEKIIEEVKNSLINSTLHFQEKIDIDNNNNNKKKFTFQKLEKIIDDFLIEIEKIKFKLIEHSEQNKLVDELPLSDIERMVSNFKKEKKTKHSFRFKENNNSVPSLFTYLFGDDN